MAKVDAVQAAKDAMAAAEDSALGSLYDAAFADGVASVPAAPAPAPVPGTFTQADIDAAVAAKDAADQSAMQAAVKAVQDQLDTMSAQDNADKGEIAALQGKLDQIKALLS